MSSSMATEVDRSSRPSPEDEADALAYMIRTGHGDLAEMLGLVEPADRPTTPGRCPLCDNPLPKHGVCRKRIVCRAAAAKRAEELRVEQDRAVDQLLDAVLAESEPTSGVRA